MISSILLLIYLSAVTFSAALGRFLEKKTDNRKRMVSGIFSVLTAAGGLLGLIKLHDSVITYSVYSLFLVISLYISYEDVMFRIVPDAYLWLIPCGLLSAKSWSELVIKIAGIFIVGIVGLLLALMSKGEGIGGADIKFMITSAALNGPYCLCAIFIGSFLGLIIGPVIQKHQKERHSSIPLIPFLCIGSIVSLLLWP